MSRGLFITATGTSVGKTLVSACITRALMDSGKTTAYFKPVETGYLPEAGEADMIRRLTGCTEVYVGDTYALAASPHLAAREENRPVASEHLILKAQQLAREYDAVVVEGAGGLAVPLDDSGYTMANLASEIGFPLVIVADAGLGTLNHTLLTVQYARDAALPILGLVLNRYADSLMHRSNAETLAQLTGLPVLAILPELPEVTPERVRAIAAEHFHSI